MSAKAKELASFITKSRWRDLDDEVIAILKRSILDTFGVAIAAVEASPLRALRVHINDFNPTGQSTLIGDGLGAPDMASLYNAGLISYLDFHDGYMARGETAHPSMVLAGVLATLEYHGGDGKDLLLATAIGYQVMAKLCDRIKMRNKGLDKTLHVTLATAAAVGKILDLDRDRMMHAISIAATNGLALRSSQTGSLSDWTHLSTAGAVKQGLEAAFLAQRGVTGPSDVFEGNRGLEEIIDASFDIDWPMKDFELIKRVSLRKYNADIHAQSAIEATIQLRATNDITRKDVKAIHVETFKTAHELIGGGNGDARTDVMNREEAARSLPFLVSAALLDGQLEPSQYRHRRIRQKDMREMTDRVFIKANDAYTEAFPDKLCCKITIEMEDGTEYSLEKKSYEGFYSQPMEWDRLTEKFNKLTEDYANDQLREICITAVETLEERSIDDLARIFSRVEPQ